MGEEREAERRPWPPAAKAAAGCGLGCAALVLLEALLLWGVVRFWLGGGARAALAARVTVPTEVTAGRPFPVTLVVRNAGDRPVTVDGIAIRGAEGLRLENPQPPPTQRLRLFDSTFWAYQRRLAPGETWRLRMEGVADRPGEARATIDVQAGFAMERVPVRVRVAAGRSGVASAASGG